MVRVFFACFFSCFFGSRLLLAEESSADQRAVDAIAHPDSLSLSLWADSTQLANPVAFTFDHHGKMYVCQTFRQNKGVEDNRSHMDWLDDDLAAESVEDRLAYFKKHLGDKISDYEAEEDRITLVVDTDGDGRADKDWVFADGFNSALTGTGAGVLVHGDAVFYTCIPELWKITDADGDGLSDVKVPLHQGYGVRVAFRGHDLHGLVLGPDGRIYFSIGDRGYNIRTPDGRVLKDPESGAVFRCELDGSGLEVFATGLRNPQELVFDDAGNLFTGDNNSDSGDEARWLHLIEGGDSGWRMSFQYLPDRGPWNREKLWHPRHDGQPAFIIPPIINFADGPSGLTYYPGTGLGNEYRGTFFLCDFRGDAAMSGVRSFKMSPEGASFEMTEPRKFLWNVLATDVDFGPDGALYVSDWIAGWDGINRGRIVRVTNPLQENTATVRSVQRFLSRDITEEQTEELLARLGNLDRRVRMKSQMELARRGTVAALTQLITESRNRFARLHATWTLGQIARTNADRQTRILDEITKLVNDSDPNVRAAAVKVLGDVPADASLNALTNALHDKNARVRALAGISLGKLGSPQAVRALLTVIAENDDMDAVVRHGGVMGLAGSATVGTLAGLATDSRRSVRIAAVLALRRLESEKLAAFLHDEDPFVVAEAARAIHDQPVAAAFPSLARLIQHPDSDDELMRRVLNANFRIGDSASAMAVARVIASERVSEAMKLEAIDMLGLWGMPSNRDRVLGMWRPLEPRDESLATPAIRSIVSDERTLAGLTPTVAVAISRVAARAGITEAAAAIHRLALDARVEPADRANLLVSLSDLKFERLADVIDTSLHDPTPEVRSRARTILADIDPGRGVLELARGVDAQTRLERQSALKKLANLSSEAARQPILGAATRLVEGDIPADTQLDVVFAATEHGLESTIAPFVESFQGQPYGEKQLAAVGGDAEKGEKLFRENLTLSCLRCHSVGDTGGRVGPNLAGIGKEKTADYLLASIVDPNKEIAKGFGTLIVATDDGVQHQGVVLQETDDLIELVDADGKRFHIDKSEVIARNTGKSAMPEDLTKDLSLFELRDLIAYLASLKTPWVEDAGHE